LTEIHKDATKEASDIGADEVNGGCVGTADLAELEILLQGSSNRHDNAEVSLLDLLLPKHALQGGDVDSWVELLQQLGAVGGAVLPNVILGQIKMGTKICYPREREREGGGDVRSDFDEKEQKQQRTAENSREQQRTERERERTCKVKRKKSKRIGKKEKEKEKVKEKEKEKELAKRTIKEGKKPRKRRQRSKKK